MRLQSHYAENCAALCSSTPYSRVKASSSWSSANFKMIIACSLTWKTTRRTLLLLVGPAHDTLQHMPARNPPLTEPYMALSYFTDFAERKDTVLIRGDFSGHLTKVSRSSPWSASSTSHPFQPDAVTGRCCHTSAEAESVVPELQEPQVC